MSRASGIGMTTRLPLRAAVTGAWLASAVAGAAAQSARPPEPVTVTQLDRGDRTARQAQPVTPPLEPLAVTQLEARPRTGDLESRRPISLAFAAPVPIRDVLLLLVRNTNLSLVPDADVEGSFAGELKNVTLRQALESVLQPLALDYSVQDDIIRVFRRRMVTRIFDINWVVTRRSGSRSLGASSSATGGSSALVAGDDTGDLFEEFDRGLRTLLSDGARYSLDRRAGLLQATDFPDRLEKVSLYLDAVQARVNRQVRIEARVIEVELNEAHAAGIDWSLVLDGTKGGVDFSRLLAAFARQGRVNVLSSAQVMAMNNEPALMRVGTQDVAFIRTTQVDETTGRIVQTTVTPTPITEGVVLAVTPQIGGDGMILVSISPSITERTGQATSRLGDTAPILSVREADTLVRIHSGETVVIAGLTQGRTATGESRVPVLGHLPLVGRAFRREERIPLRTDLVILLTPTIVTPGALMGASMRVEERMSEAQQAPAER